MPKLELHCDNWTRFEKNEDGDTVKRKYRRGDTVEVTDAQSEALLKLEVGGRPLFRKPKSVSKSNEDEKAQTQTQTSGQTQTATTK